MKWYPLEGATVTWWLPVTHPGLSSCSPLPSTALFRQINLRLGFLTSKLGLKIVPISLWWEWKETLHVKQLGWYLARGKCSIQRRFHCYHGRKCHRQGPLNPNSFDSKSHIYFTLSNSCVLSTRPHGLLFLFRTPTGTHFSVLYLFHQILPNQLVSSLKPNTIYNRTMPFYVAPNALIANQEVIPRSY